MIYCVVPQELVPELYDRMLDYYADDPHVTVIIDRRRTARRLRDGEAAAAANGGANGDGASRSLRDRRRARVAGDFPPIPDDVEE